MLEVINAPTERVWGGPLTGNGTAGLIGAGRVVSGIGAAANARVIVDTGSTGISVPPRDVNLSSLGAPTGVGTIYFDS